MANTILTITDIAREAVMVLHEKLALAKIATRKYESRFGNTAGNSRAIGTKLTIPRPAKYTVGTSADITSLNKDLIESSVEINVTTRRNVALSFTSNDLALKITDFAKKNLEGPMSRLAREIDIVGFNLLKVSPQTRYGRTVTSAMSFSDYVQMNALMTAQLCPEDRRNLFAGSLDHAVVVDALKGLFQSSEDIADQYANGYMGTSGGFEWVSTENTPTITWAAAIPVAGTLTATPAEAATVIAVTGMGANAQVKAGAGFTVAGCYAIDPETQTQLNYLYTFIAASDVTLGASGEGNITVADAMYTVSGTNRSLANMSALPQSGAVITPTEAGSVASKSGKLVFGVHADALALACVDMADPDTGVASQANYEGISLRVWRFSDGLLDTHTTRVDVQFGWGLLNKEFIVSTVGLVK